MEHSDNMKYVTVKYILFMLDLKKISFAFTYVFLFKKYIEAPSSRYVAETVILIITILITIHTLYLITGYIV